MITSWDKALVSAIIGILSLATIWFGYDFSRVSEEALLSFFAVAGPILVWLIPNRKVTT